MPSGLYIVRPLHHPISCSSIFIPFLCEGKILYLFFSWHFNQCPILISYFLRRFYFYSVRDSNQPLFYSLYSYFCCFVPYIRTCPFEVLNRSVCEQLVGLTFPIRNGKTGKVRAFSPYVHTKC
jgi:hypothetical protein